MSSTRPSSSTRRWRLPVERARCWAEREALAVGVEEPVREGVPVEEAVGVTLGVPLVNHARTYRGVAKELIEVLPIGYQCAISGNVGDPRTYGVTFGISF